MKKEGSTPKPDAFRALAPDNLPYQLFLLVQQMTKQFQTVLRPHGITPLHWGILSCLWLEDGLRISEVARRLDQLGGTLTVGVNAMVRDGWIERRRTAHDGRGLELFLTDRGRKLRSSLEPRAEQLIEQMVRPLSSEQRTHFEGSIAVLRRHLAEGIDDSGKLAENGAPRHRSTH